MRLRVLTGCRGWDVARAIASGLYSVVVLDELNPVLNLGLLPVDEVVQVLKSKPEELKLLLLVGCPTTSDIADLHSEMKPTSTLLRRNRVFPVRFIQVRVKESLPVRSVRRCKRLAGNSQDQSHRVLIMQWLRVALVIQKMQQSPPYSKLPEPRGSSTLWTGCNCMARQQQELDYVEAERGWEIARAALASGLYKTIILDELNPS